jgi:hypothetical protein
MKIIKKTDTINWSCKYTCDKCDTEMEVEKGDLKYKYLEADRPGGIGDDTFSFYCPECHDKVEMITAKIPKLVQIEVKNAPKKSIMDDFESNWRNK